MALNEPVKAKPALLIDLDGVLYQGDSAIAGASETMDWVKAENIPYLYLTNTTSVSRKSLLEKFDQLGIEAEAEDIFTPIIATSQWLGARKMRRGVLFVTKNALPDFSGIDIIGPDTESRVDAVVVGDLGEGWDFFTLNRAFRLLMREPKPVLIALGMTRYWAAADGLRLDVAPFVKALEFASDTQAQVIGKPSPAFYESALSLLECEPGNALMIGDDIVGDIEGAQSAGLRSILVKTGKFREQDLQGSIKPDALLDTIADLPAWWAEKLG
ncbi:MAG: TIGR01458 family HAD-type hydrolase [Gammaproteobacteria bacterium]